MGYDRNDCWMTCGERDDKCAALGIDDPWSEIERLRASAQRAPDREQVAALLYVTRFPHRTWIAASGDETAIAYKQADTIIALNTTEGKR